MAEDKVKKPSTLPPEELDEEGLPPGLFDKLRIFYEAHSRAITSTLLLLIVVGCAVGIVLYRQHVREKQARLDVEACDDLAKLQTLLEKWKDTGVKPIILYKMGTLYFGEGTLEGLEKARDTWKRLMNEFPKHPLVDRADAAYMKVEKDIRWWEDNEPVLRHEHRLTYHPDLHKLWGGDEFRVGPRGYTDPTVEIKRGDSTSVLRLFADEAPEPVDEFLKAVREKKLDGATLAKEGDNAIAIVVGTPAPAAWTLPRNSRKLTSGTVAVTVGDDGKPVAGKYLLILKDIEEKTDAYCAIGWVESGMVTELPFKEGTKIDTAKIARERELMSDEAPKAPAMPELPFGHP